MAYTTQTRAHLLSHCTLQFIQKDSGSFIKAITLPGREKKALRKTGGVGGQVVFVLTEHTT